MHQKDLPQSNTRKSAKPASCTDLMHLGDKFSACHVFGYLHKAQGAAPLQTGRPDDGGGEGGPENWREAQNVMHHVFSELPMRSGCAIQEKTRENVLLQGAQEVAHGHGKLIANGMNSVKDLIVIGMNRYFRLAEAQSFRLYNNERKLLLQ